MFFGLCNSPATFQTMMNEIFADMDDNVVVYIDDIMIFTKGSLAEHQTKVKEVLQCLCDNDLFARPEKCSFDKTEVEYLGMFVNRDGICMDDSKVKAITEWPAPMMVRGIHSFLGLANFYQRFIKDYAILAKPLTDLTQKDKAFTWGSMEANTFASLKTRFTTAPILAYPDNDSLCMHIISSHHDSPIAGHPGSQKTQELIERQYYWPRLAMDIRSYVTRCDRCTRFKGGNTKPAGS